MEPITQNMERNENEKKEQSIRETTNTNTYYFWFCCYPNVCSTDESECCNEC